MQDYKVSFCIVLYQQPFEVLTRVVRSILLYQGEKRLYLIDNSATNKLESLSQLDTNITYMWLGQNVGFGQANNIAIKMASEWGSKYHFMVNPDIYYTEDVASQMIAYMETHRDVGGMMPQILNPDHTNQFLPKLAPSPWTLFWRKCQWPAAMHKKVIQTFEMRSMKQDRPYDIIHITGCFCAYRTDILVEVGGFDDRYFMYFEDTDLSRRIHSKWRTIYYPLVHVFHDYGNGAAKEPRLFFRFIVSAFKYFCKWGFIDVEGQKLNKAILSQLASQDTLSKNLCNQAHRNRP